MAPAEDDGLSAPRLPKLGSGLGMVPYPGDAAKVRTVSAWDFELFPRPTTAEVEAVEEARIEGQGAGGWIGRAASKAGQGRALRFRLSSQSRSVRRWRPRCHSQSSQ